MDNLEFADVLIEMAKEIEKETPIDFGYLNVDEDSLYKTIALGLIEEHFKSSKETRELVLLSTCLHLVIENAVLNMKVMQK
jgi:hypothetical protein